MKFTVLIPTHDNGPLIRFAIQSVLYQDFADWELLIVADGAREDTLALVNSFARQDPRIRCFEYPKGERHGEAWRHEALKHATGDAVCYLSDDDFWFPDHLSTMTGLLSEHDFVNTIHTEISLDCTVTFMCRSLQDPAIRSRMQQERFNCFGLSFAGHRLDKYWLLSEGWSPAPIDIWTDLNMWRKWLSDPMTRAYSLKKATALHFAKPKRLHMSEKERLSEIEDWFYLISQYPIISHINENINKDIFNIELLDFYLNYHSRRSTVI